MFCHVHSRVVVGLERSGQSGCYYTHPSVMIIHTQRGQILHRKEHKSKLTFDHRMVDNLGNTAVGCVKRHSTVVDSPEQVEDFAVVLWMALCQRPDGYRGDDYANTDPKKEYCSYGLPLRAPL